MILIQVGFILIGVVIVLVSLYCMIKLYQSSLKECVVDRPNSISCSRCGYNLNNISFGPNKKCPECGLPYESNHQGMPIMKGHTAVLVVFIFVFVSLAIGWLFIEILK